MNRFGYDDVNGIVIGDTGITGRLHRYDTGAMQGPQFSGDSDDEVKEQALKWYNENGGKRLWPNGLELRLRP